jgi:hypothetical protein
MRVVWAILLTAVAIWPVQALAAAPDEKTFPYSNFSDASKRLKDAKKFDLLSIRLRARVPGGERDPKDLVFTIPRPGGDLILKPEPDGTLTLPDDPALTAANPTVRVNLPKDAKFSLSVDLQIKKPDADPIPYSYLAAALKQLNNLIGEQAGMMSFLAPSPRGVRLFCGKGCVGTLNTTPAKQIAANEAGAVVLMDPDWRGVQGLTISLSQPLTVIRPIVN